MAFLVYGPGGAPGDGIVASRGADEALDTLQDTAIQSISEGYFLCHDTNTSDTKLTTSYPLDVLILASEAGEFLLNVTLKRCMQQIGTYICSSHDRHIRLGAGGRSNAGKFMSYGVSVSQSKQSSELPIYALEYTVNSIKTRVGVVCIPSNTSNLSASPSNDATKLLEIFQPTTILALSSYTCPELQETSTSDLALCTFVSNFKQNNHSKFHIASNLISNSSTHFSMVEGFLAAIMTKAHLNGIYSVSFIVNHPMYSFLQPIETLGLILKQICQENNISNESCTKLSEEASHILQAIISNNKENDKWINLQHEAARQFRVRREHHVGAMYT